MNLYLEMSNKRNDASVFKVHNQTCFRQNQNMFLIEVIKISFQNKAPVLVNL